MKHAYIKEYEDYTFRRDRDAIGSRRDRDKIRLSIDRHNGAERDMDIIERKDYSRDVLISTYESFAANHAGLFHTN